MSTKNDPKNKGTLKQKLIGPCGHEVIPVRVKGIRGGARMLRYCEKCETKV
jgi:hypothetical protein